MSAKEERGPSREIVAAMMLQGLLSNPGIVSPTDRGPGPLSMPSKRLVSLAYAYADALAEGAEKKAGDDDCW